MKIPTIDELRMIRGQLSDQCQNDVEKYAKMLAEVSQRRPGTYVKVRAPKDDIDGQPTISTEIKTRRP